MAREVGQHPQHGDDRDRYARGQPVEAVRQVRAVRHGRHHEDRHQHVEQPRGRSVASGEPAVVELVVLDEGNGRLRGLDRFGAEHHRLPHALHRTPLLVEIDRLHGPRGLLAHDDLGREPHGRPDDDTQPDLSHDLEAPLEALLAVAKHLDVVVQSADQPQPDGRDQHQLHVNVVQLAQQQRRDEDGDEDDHAAHRRRAPLLELPLEPQVADLLADLLAAQEVDDPPPEDDDDEQRKDHRRRRAERNILEHTRARDVIIFA